MLALATVLALSMQPAVTLSDTERGTWLFQSCQGAIRWLDAADDRRRDAEQLNFANCTSYVSGFLDAESLFTDCLAPESATIGTFIRVYAQYMTEHPKLLDEHKGIGLQASYRDAYPCPAGKKP